MDRVKLLESVIGFEFLCKGNISNSYRFNICPLILKNASYAVEIKKHKKKKMPKCMQNIGYKSKQNLDHLFQDKERFEKDLNLYEEARRNYGRKIKNENND